jgi:hypothetical protein
MKSVGMILPYGHRQRLPHWGKLDGHLAHALMQIKCAECSNRMMEYKRQFRQYNFPSRWLRQLLEREAFFRRSLLSMNYWAK